MVNKYHSIEEVKMMYESAEKITDRRLALNKFNYTINLAVLSALGLVWKFTFSDEHLFFLGTLFILILTALATSFCTLWVKQIKNYKQLNDAKFEVIKDMSQNLSFDSSNPNTSQQLYGAFEEEWRKIKKIRGALQKNKRFGIKAMSSTNAEYFVPQALRVIFILFFLLSVVIIMNNSQETWDSILYLIRRN